MAQVAGPTRPVKRYSDTPGLDPKVKIALIELENKIDELDRRLFDAERRLAAGGL